MKEKAKPSWNGEAIKNYDSKEKFLEDTAHFDKEEAEAAWDKYHPKEDKPKDKSVK